MTRVLIANRGEIARRVIATCHRLGLEAVAVCSDPDLDAPHVREADVAVRLPGASAADTYLRAKLLLDAAAAARADAVHPGYGFLSENPGFARDVIDAGLTWIGPSPEAIEAMGSKIESKRLAAAADVPVLAELDPGEVTEADLPVLVKASAGGGGRGMRIVRHLADLAGEIKVAQSEAGTSFSDSRVFIEPFVEHGHHVEVQVMADRHGTVLVLGERECSIQRRHQKVIEESPSPLVERTPGLRERLFEAATTVARAVGYTGAGTVEFLATSDGRFWFLEMNTRIQVEHPVTECVTGVDVVEWQLLVASGGRLPPRPQAQANPALQVPRSRGASIEVRLYAEDPAANWQPATGTLHLLDVAASQPAFSAPVLDLTPRGVRLDSGVEDGALIGVHYDPMLAKVIAWAPTRAEAVNVLARTLTRARIHGPRTNRDLLVRVLRHPDFGTGDTGFLERHDLTAPLVSPEDERLAAVAAALAEAARRRDSAGVLRELPSGWRNVPTSPQRTVLTGPCGEHVVEYRGATAPGVRVVSVTPDTVVLEADGLMRRWHVARYEGDDRLFVDGDTGSVTFTEVRRFAEADVGAQEGSLRAPMPGTVVVVAVAVGDEIEAGQELLAIEAMKMRYVVHADRAGRVASLAVSEGQTVDVGATLAVIT
ncbi:MAG TPA: biotin carboxylase N-terminal domain-containing protein [Streptosporangiaceae bacterium]